MERNLSPRLFRDGIKQAIHKPAFPLVVESLGDVDIFTDDRPRRHVDACQKFIAPGPQNLVHRLVQPRKGPALGQPSLDQGIDLSPALVPRSEERRVGKECVSPCRSRWSPYHSKNKKKSQNTTTKTTKPNN